MRTRNIIPILMVFLLIIALTPPSSGVEADVTIRLEYDNYRYECKQHDSDELFINGTVSCSTDGLGSEAQQIKVELFLGDSRGWTMGGGPYSFIFDSNGTQDFILKITIPKDTKNRTENTVVVSGTWESEPHLSSIFKSTGSATLDEVNITVIKRLLDTTPDPEPNGDKDLQFWLERNFQLLMVIIICAALIISSIVITFFKVRNWLREKKYK